MSCHHIFPWIRWAVSRDLPAVTEIDSLAFADNWSRADFILEIRRRPCIMTVAEYTDGNVIGYMLYEPGQGRIEINRFAVHLAWQRMGVGTALLRKLMPKLVKARRDLIRVQMREDRIGALLLLQSLGFIATEVQKYNDNSCHDIVMVYRSEWLESSGSGTSGAVLK
jgi:ribosomal protein S18 acetylase RimI-like enzyme